MCSLKSSSHELLSYHKTTSRASPRYHRILQARLSPFPLVMSIALRFWWEKIRKAFGSWQSNLRSGILITTICMVNGNGLHTLILLANSKNQSTRNQHLRRPKGSQSGREKRRDESFQVRAKEPLGTDSHRTISKNSSGCRLLIGHKKCFVLLCPIGEQFLLSSFREFVHDGYCLAKLARFVHQACACKENFYFLLS